MEVSRMSQLREAVEKIFGNASVVGTILHIEDRVKGRESGGLVAALDVDGPELLIRIPHPVRLRNRSWRRQRKHVDACALGTSGANPFTVFNDQSGRRPRLAADISTQKYPDGRVVVASAHERMVFTFYPANVAREVRPNLFRAASSAV
jgi:hypothetical protein